MERLMRSILLFFCRRFFFCIDSVLILFIIKTVGKDNADAALCRFEIFSRRVGT